MQADKLQEQSVLGGLILGGRPFPDEFHLLQDECFTGAREGQVWCALQNLIELGEPVDQVTVYRELWRVGCGEGAASYLADITGNVPSLENLGHWIKLLAEDGRKRKIRATISDAMARVEDGADVETVGAAVQDAIRRVDQETTQGLTHIRNVLPDTVKQITEAVLDPDADRVAKTGIADLDARAKLRAQQLTVIAGRPGMGKSALAGNIASHSAQHGLVALFSLEMSAIDFVRRMIQARLHRDPVEVDHTAVQKAAESLSAIDLYIDDAPGLSVPDMAASLRKLGKPRLVVVDYLQLTRVEERSERHDLKIGMVTKGLKALAKEFDCHVIVLCQLNRSVEASADKRPQMSHLRDSGNIEEDADNVWLLYREDYYFADRNPGVAEISVSKQRHGQTGTVTVTWLPKAQLFADAMRGTEAANGSEPEPGWWSK